MNKDKRELRYGKNVDLFLGALSQIEPTELDGGVFDFHWGDGSTTPLDMTELAADALQIIVNLRKERDALAVKYLTARHPHVFLAAPEVEITVRIVEDAE